MHLFGTIRLLIFSKKSHLYVYFRLYFIHFCQIYYVSYWHMKQKTVLLSLCMAVRGTTNYHFTFLMYVTIADKWNMKVSKR